MVAILHAAHNSYPNRLRVIKSNVLYIAIKVENLILQKLIQRFLALHFEIHIDPPIFVDQLISKHIGSKCKERPIAIFMMLKGPLHNMIRSWEVLFSDVMGSPKFHIEIWVLVFYCLVQDHSEFGDWLIADPDLVDVSLY